MVSRTWAETFTLKSYTLKNIMINIIIRSIDYSSVGEDDGEIKCINTIRFDRENIIIKSEQNGKQRCSILFEITPSLIKELKILTSALDIDYEK